VIGIAGAPGSGVRTLAADLAAGAPDLEFRILASDLRDHARCALTLLCASDDPADAAVEQRLRAALAASGLAWSVLTGPPPARLAQARAALQRALAPPPEESAHAPRWHWHCERCGDADCERHRLPRL